MTKFLANFWQATRKFYVGLGLWCVAAGLCTAPAKAQVGMQFEKEYAFARYLFDGGQYADAQLLLPELMQRFTGPGQQDTLHWLAGKLYYQQKMLPQANRYWRQVSKQHAPLWQEAQWFSFYNHAYLHQYDSAQALLSQFNGNNDAFYQALYHFEQAGLALLQRNMPAYKAQSARFTGQYYAFANQEQKLAKWYQDIQARPKRKPWVAAGLSAIVPGLGRIYTGRPGQGLLSLLTHAFIGVQALEGYRKDGPQSARFIVYAVVLGGFYIANIYGSALSVKVTQTEFNEAVNQQILLDMHIPLRTIFH